MTNKIKETEHQIQCALVEYIRLKHPKVLFWATPNGGLRNKIVAAKMKKEGVLSGVPDLFIAEAREEWHGLFVELKAKNGKLTKNQKAILQHLCNLGYSAILCNSFDSAIYAIDTYLKLPKWKYYDETKR